MLGVCDIILSLLKFGKNVVVDVVQIVLVVWLCELLLNALLQDSEVFGVEEFEFVCDLVKLSLLL